ncbi:MAG: hypothetical protein NTV24_03325 [Candidatus Woesebacteria bacterium]|nr:hypothetical protein [Candidatus Woesebacteria bacterium]
MKDVNTYESKDKQIVPFLLIQQDVQFLGVRESGNIIYFQFSPSEKCLKLVNDFMSRKAPLVQPKDLLDAIETFRDRVFEMKEKNKYGGSSG